MKCLLCNNVMEKGRLMNKGGVYFLPDGEKYPKLYAKREMEKHKAVYFPPYMFDVPAVCPTAYICRDCSKIVIDYELYK